MSALGRSLLQALVLYCCFASAMALAFVAILFVLTWLSASQWVLIGAAFAGPTLLVGVLPWLGLAYVLSSARFPVRWHWFVSAIAALAATGGVRYLPFLSLGRGFVGQIQGVCRYQAGEIVTFSSFFACAVTTWSTLVQGAVIYAGAAGAILFLVVSALQRTLPRRS
jgi:hypothetical protein